MASFTIDGKVFSGRSITIRNGIVTIDGVVQDGTLHGQVEIKVTEGIIERLEADGSVTCGEVRGNVSAGGSVHCENVCGNVSAGGSVSASGHLGKSISAGGSVRVG